MPDLTVQVRDRDIIVLEAKRRSFDYLSQRSIRPDAHGS